MIPNATKYGPEYEVPSLIPNTTKTNKKKIQKLSLVSLFTNLFFSFGGYPENRAVFKFSFQTHLTTLEIMQVLGGLWESSGENTHSPGIVIGF